MTSDWKPDVVIPDGLEEAVQAGLQRGRQVCARRARVRQWTARSVLSLVLVLALFAGGVNLSPAFAAALADVPVLGTLVRVFQRDAPQAEGGHPGGADQVSLTLERDGEEERLILRYDQDQAALYQVRYERYPGTITLTLPDTGRVEVLDAAARARDASQYIKEVSSLPSLKEGSAVLQIELERDAGVQVAEYQNPGSVVLTLTPAPDDLTEIYSLRTLSVEEERFPTLTEGWTQTGETETRTLRDEQGLLFLELGQYASRAEADQAAAEYARAELFVERRVGNNTPACFTSLEAVESAALLDEYYALLLTSDTVEPLLAFLDEHLAQAEPETQEILLLGLTGFLQGGEEPIDLERLEPYYAMAGQEIPARLLLDQKS